MQSCVSCKIVQGYGKATSRNSAVRQLVETIYKRFESPWKRHHHIFCHAPYLNTRRMFQLKTPWASAENHCPWTLHCHHRQAFNQYSKHITWTSSASRTTRSWYDRCHRSLPIWAFIQPPPTRASRRGSSSHALAPPLKSASCRHGRTPWTLTSYTPPKGSQSFFYCSGLKYLAIIDISSG